ncbi:MAG: hypothetical protein KDA22_10650 [Phycisphaerales bacterium]|nr:hypothetical protein [Phycisphaerales bacterium]
MFTIRFYAIAFLLYAGFLLFWAGGAPLGARVFALSASAVLLAMSILTWRRSPLAAGLVLAVAIVMIAMGLVACLGTGVSRNAVGMIVSGLVLAPGCLVLRSEFAKLRVAAATSEARLDSAVDRSRAHQRVPVEVANAGIGGDDHAERQRMLEVVRARYVEMIAKHAGAVRLEGGSGDSLETAVVVSGAVNETVGINAEYRCLERRFGRRNRDWHLVQQRLDNSRHGRIFDVLRIRLADGTEPEIWFDIADFFGKSKVDGQAQHRARAEGGGRRFAESPEGTDRDRRVR